MSGRSRFCLAVALGLLGARAAPAGDDPPDLKPLLAEVRELVAKHYPAAAVTREKQYIHVEFNTRKFMVHEPLLTGEWQDATEETGPQKGGIHADLSLNPGPYRGMAALPQSFDKRYFTLRVLAPNSKRLDRHLLVHLKYPRDVPKGFLRGFETLVNGFESHLTATPATPPAVPPGGAGAGGPPVATSPPVYVNSQPSLRKAVGKGFEDAGRGWENPKDLLPTEFPGLCYVSGPADRNLPPKGGWRKPVVLRHAPSGTEVSVNCYRRQPEPLVGPPAAPGAPGTPFTPLTEPDYRYKTVTFHDTPAAAGSPGPQGNEGVRQAVFAFVLGDRLFKVECAGEEGAEHLETLARSVAEAIHQFRERR